jgi:hypothetical protein
MKEKKPQSEMIYLLLVILILFYNLWNMDFYKWYP